MRVYIEITGHIKNHQNFKILFWSRESKKLIFRIFPEFFRSRPGLARTGGCRDPGSRNRQPAASARGNGFSVLRIFLTGPVPRRSPPGLHRRLTRDSRNRRLTRNSCIPDFSRKKNP